jgi:hypothetical protein
MEADRRQWYDQGAPKPAEAASTRAADANDPGGQDNSRVD